MAETTNASTAEVQRVEGKVDALAKVLTNDRLTNKAEGSLAMALGFLGYRVGGAWLPHVAGDLGSELEQLTAASFVIAAGGFLRGGRWLMQKFTSQEGTG